MNKALIIFAIEMDSKFGDKEANLSYIENKFKELPEGIDIVVLPEMFSTGYITDDKDLIWKLSEKNIDSTINRLRKLSQEYKVAITGTFLARTNIYVYNRAFFIEPSGEEIFYDKHHLFSMGGEDDFYKAGNEMPPIIRYRGWNIMPVICYDLRFPVWLRNVDRKYDLLLVMANWPVAREYAWTQLLIARAIENQCYVCGVNRTGVDQNGFEYPTSSSVILNYKGKIISKTYSTNIIAASLSWEKYANYLEKFPTWKDNDRFSIIDDFA